MTTCGSMSTFNRQAKQTTAYVNIVYVNSVYKMLCHDQKWQHNGSLRFWSRLLSQQLNTPRPSRSSAKLRINIGSTSSSMVESTIAAAAAGSSAVLTAFAAASAVLLSCHQMQVFLICE